MAGGVQAETGAAVGRGPALGGRLLAPWRGLALFGLGLLAAVTAWLLILAMLLLIVWVGFILVPPAARALRSLAHRQLTLGQRWSGVAPTTVPQDPAAISAPGAPVTAPGTPAFLKPAAAVLSHSSTWRRLGWAQLALTLPVGLLALLPFALIAHGVFGIALPFLWEPLVSTWGDGNWFLFVHLTSYTSAQLAAGLGVAEIILAFGFGPHILRAQARLSRALLG
ncbi:sensor domain-containing protein [Streptomyces pinistramenti]|uniref:sensor domain-containing protein n=1 Tax=Streptomyces pinistramenti TaxID=2884812 RepID=UPI001D06D381|nr:sensor domain-containing protein [Streptomyces pinistramenti]MCB5908655.1 sensor domain-containing protein [Streptomyces pinistramenti]